MKILYISYWSLNEPLTAATIIPYFKLWNDYDSIKEIHFATIERGNEKFHEIKINIAKVTHHPMTTRFQDSFLFSKLYEFTRIPSTLSKLAKSLDINLIMAKTSLAGSLAYKIHKQTDLPFIVESFEPHSDYMMGCGEWKKNGFLYKFAKYYERKQLKHAQYIVTVTHNYKNHLIEHENVDGNKIKVIPSITEIEKFVFNSEDRQKVRDKLNLGSSVTGIYVGKFGGLYYDAEAYDIFRTSNEHFGGKMKFIILTPEDPDLVYRNMEERGINRNSVHVQLASHEDVPMFLSASDFAFATIKPAFSNPFQCPVKNGEYWANGLPILMTYGIADDYKIMEEGQGVALYDLTKNDLSLALKKIEEIINTPDYRLPIYELAVKYKSIKTVKSVYNELFKLG